MNMRFVSVTKLSNNRKRRLSLGILRAINSNAQLNSIADSGFREGNVKLLNDRIEELKLILLSPWPKFPRKDKKLYKKNAIALYNAYVFVKGWLEETLNQ